MIDCRNDLQDEFNPEAKTLGSHRCSIKVRVSVWVLPIKLEHINYSLSKAKRSHLNNIFQLDPGSNIGIYI